MENESPEAKSAQRGAKRRKEAQRGATSEPMARSVTRGKLAGKANRRPRARGGGRNFISMADGGEAVVGPLLERNRKPLISGPGPNALAPLPPVIYYFGAVYANRFGGGGDGGGPGGRGGASHPGKTP
jgi:hypothetical protein